MKTPPFGFDPEAMKANPMLANPMFAMWQQQWNLTNNPMVRMQIAWMESLAATMQLEANFLKSVAEGGVQVSKCFEGDQPKTPEELQACYQELVQKVKDAQMQRMQSASQLSEDFRKRLWEEL